jgi:hypothetical protein
MTRRPLQIFAWLALAAIIFVTVSPIGLRPSDILPVNMDRALACAGMAGLFVLAYPRHWLWVGLVMVFGAGLIEVLQLLSPTRHARVDDAIVKASGALMGVLAAHLINITQQVLSKSIEARPSPDLLMSDFHAGAGSLPPGSRLIESIFFKDGELRIRLHDGREHQVSNASENTPVVAADPVSQPLTQPQPAKATRRQRRAA